MTKNRTLEYQTEAINKVVQKFLKFDTVVLQAPTGSGKTYIIAKIIERIICSNSIQKPYAFLYLAPSNGGLANQGYDKITSYLERNWANGFFTKLINGNGKDRGKSDYLAGVDFFRSNYVYFIGWNTLSKNSNATKKETEKNNIYDVLEETKRRKINLIVIVDEAHREYLSSKVKNEIKTNKTHFFKQIQSMTLKTLEVSATPKEVILDDAKIKISVEDVRNEAAIKKAVIINDFSYSNHDHKTYDDEDNINLLIKQGIKKQQQVKKSYERAKITDQNPLILIQIPDKASQIYHEGKKINIDDYYKKKVEKIVKHYADKYAFKYAIWLSGKKQVEKNDLIKRNSVYEVLVFKQAIATGWDIPRANILIKLRNPKKGSRIFEIQTLGRILRNPFFKYFFEKRNTKDGELINNAFVFTFDEEYQKRVKKHEAYVVKKEKFKLSSKGRKSNLELNKLAIEKKFKNNSFDQIYSELKSQKIIQKILDESMKDIQEPIVSKSRQQSTHVLKGEIKTNPRQTKLQLLSKNTLFQIWLDFQTFIEGYPKLKVFFIKLVDKIWQEHKKIKKKQLYQFFSNKLFSTTIKNGDILKIEIEKVFLKHQKDNFKIIQKDKPWILTDHNYKWYPKNYHNDDTGKDWDDVNSYQIKLDCEKAINRPEQKFYEFIQDWFRDDKVKKHILRNGTTLDSDFFIPYISSENKIRNFFPDFILETEKNIVIMEVKGKRDLEKNAKFNWATELINHLIANKNKNLIIAFLEVSEDSNHKIWNWKVLFKNWQEQQIRYLPLKKFREKFLS